MKKREFSSKDQVAIVQFLMHQKKKEKLQKGAVTLAAKQFKCNRMTISRIWKRASENNCQGESYANVDSLKKKQNCGRKCKDYGEKLEKLRHIPLSRRGTILAFDNISPEILDNTFLSLQQVMPAAMKNDGSNNFKLAHIGKAKLRSQGSYLPVQNAATKLLKNPETSEHSR